MRIITGFLMKPINWLVSPEFPSLVPFEEPQGWSLISPLVQLPVHSKEVVGPIQTRDNLLFLSNYEISFAHEDDPLNREAAVSQIESTLRRLRFLSGQADLADLVAASSIQEVDGLPSSANSKVDRAPLVDVVPYVRKTALTYELVMRLAEEPVESEALTYAELLLDAIRAFQHQDYIKCILFSAFALEAGAQHCIHRDYRRLVASTSPSESHRMIELEHDDQESPRSDPIYSALMKQAKGSFRVFLHELPLYIRRRSLLQENKSLYDLALELRKSRNHIAHSGETPSSAFSTDMHGAARALNCAEAVLAWFEAEANFFLPDQVQSLLQEEDPRD